MRLGRAVDGGGDDFVRMRRARHEAKHKSAGSRGGGQHPSRPLRGGRQAAIGDFADEEPRIARAREEQAAGVGRVQFWETRSRSV